MQISKRVYGAVLAGVLACGMTCGSMAFAAGGGLLQGITGGAGTADVGAADAVENVVDDADTAGVSDFDAALLAVPSYTTVTQGPVSYQVYDGWTFSDESDADGTWYYFEDDFGMFECVVYPESMVGYEDAFSDEYVAYLDEQVPNGSFSDPVDRYLDGVLIRDVSYEASEDGIRFRGILTVVYGADYVAVADSVFMYEADYDLSSLFTQVHRSISLTGAAAAPASGPAPAPVAAVEQDGLPVEGTVQPGEAFVCEGWTITVGDDPSAYQWVTAPDDFFLENYAGAEMVAVPVQITNGTGDSADPFWLSVYTYNAQGLQQSDWPGIGFDDSIESIGSIRNGATVTCYLYAAYTGDGEYAFEFASFGEDGGLLTVEVPVQIAR